MRKVIFQNMVSLDGFFEGTNKEIYWHNVDPEFNHYVEEFLDIFGHAYFWACHLSTYGQLLAN